jgi:hypothetical protein
MKYTYEKAFDTDGNWVAINRLEDMASIPLDPRNSDYQQYLKNLDEADTL